MRQVVGFGDRFTRGGNLGRPIVTSVEFAA